MENAPSMGNLFKKKVAFCKLYISELKDPQINSQMDSNDLFMNPRS